jgi:WD40 repeat protein
LVRDVYNKDVSRVPKVVLGLSNSWSSAEIVMQNRSAVSSVAFSQDGSRVVSGSDDDTVRIWNTTTGEVQAELKGHTDWVTSVAFSQDGSRVVSGSRDNTVRIWNTTTGEVQAELEGHTSWMTSVAFSQDGSRVVSGSYDNTVRIWNTTSGDAQIVTSLITKLPDSSMVYCQGARGFHIVYPVQPILSICHSLSLSDDNRWIVGLLRDCWIPSQDSNFVSISFSGQKACFRYPSGHVIILDMTIAL